MRGFRRTLFLSHLGLVALTVLLMLVVFRNLAVSYFADQLRQRLLTHAAFARNTVAPKITDDGFSLVLKNEDLRTLQQELRSYARENQIRVVVIGGDFQTLSDSGWGKDQYAPPSPFGAPSSTRSLDETYDNLPWSERPEVRAALQGETSDTKRGSWRDVDFDMSVATPIRSTRGDGAVIACVLASAPIRLLSPTAWKIVRNFLLFIVGIVGIVIMLSIGVAQRLALPVRRLEDATRRLAAGDLKARAPLQKRFLGRGDELDKLTNEFNAMAEKIESTDRERRAFLADVSHELRTPLTAIKGSAETLRDGAWRNEKMAPRFAQTIVTQSDRLIRLVGDLLQLARIEAAVEQKINAQKAAETQSEDSAKVGIEPNASGANASDSRDENGAPISPASSTRLSNRRTARAELLHASSLCERAASAVQPLFHERGVNLRLECDDFNLRGHEDWLEQLLINLLANAARYSEESTTTVLSAKQTIEYSIFAVRDQGRGIAPEHLPHLGERFYRVEEGRERTQNESGGSGLGLAICRRIALAHGGTLEIDSALGEGTTVTVKLPV